MSYPKPLAEAVAELRREGLIVEGQPEKRKPRIQGGGVEAVLLYREGIAGKELATQLGISVSATEQRLQRAMLRLGVTDRRELRALPLDRILTVQ